MKTKVFKIHYSTYVKLRHYFPSKRGETADEYFQRLIEDVLIFDKEGKKK
jgi:hypothetical protein